MVIPNSRKIYRKCRDMTKKITRGEKSFSTGRQANDMWGGRFSVGPEEIMTEINSSLDSDRHLAAEDIMSSKIHVRMLSRQGIITSQDAETILEGLDRIASEITEGRFEFQYALEDIHMNIEARLSVLVGAEVAGRMHTARSRNDQVATDLRLWIREAMDELDGSLTTLQKALLDKAEPFIEAVMPGLTHLQPAQPITLAFHLLAYTEMLGRDRGRLQDARKRLNECPLGSAALAGTSFPIDRTYTAQALHFDRPTANALDSVSDRDFVVEFLGCVVLCGVHLSRLAEEIILWCSQGFGFITLSDTLTTGSSMMPQKRNPDAAELVRAKTGRLIGALTTLLVMLKALPLAYAKDLQEDKAPVFDATHTLSLMLTATTAMVKDFTPDTQAMKLATQYGYLTATDLADWMVRHLGLPFRKAHWRTGQIIQLAVQKNLPLHELDLEVMQTIEPRITEDVYDILDIDKAVQRRSSYGGSAPSVVRQAITQARKRFDV